MKKIAIACVSLALVSTFGFCAEKNFGEKFFTKNCKNCHGINGDKYAGDKSAKIAFLKKEEIVTALKDYKSGKRDIHGMGRVMKSEALMLKEDEMESLAEYVVSLRPKAK